MIIILPRSESPHTLEAGFAAASISRRNHAARHSEPTDPSLLPPLPAPADNAAMEAEPPNADPPKRKRRWFQFSLRTLLIGVTIFSVSCGG